MLLEWDGSSFRVERVEVQQNPDVPAAKSAIATSKSTRGFFFLRRKIKITNQFLIVRVITVYIGVLLYHHHHRENSQ